MKLATRVRLLAGDGTGGSCGEESAACGAYRLSGHFER